jgi:hypothetical protein
MAIPIPIRQASLLCGCGAPEFDSAGFCTKCQRRRRLNVENFGGQRERVMRRDDWQCRVCGERDMVQLLVHHRRPGLNDDNWLITLCRACHVRVHHTWRPSWAFLTFDLMRRLWKELHRGLPEQRLLALLAEEQREEQQAVLFRE